MENSAAANSLSWEEQEHADRARKDIEYREWLKNFGLMLAVIVLSLAVATVLANVGANWTIGL